MKSILQNRARDVLSSTSDTALSNLKIFFELLDSNLMLKSVLDELMKDLPDPEPLVAKIKSTRRIILPPSYLEKVKACLSVLQYMIRKNGELYQIMSFVSTASQANIDVMTREALKEFFEPVYVYITEKIESMDLLQYLLLRFKFKSEWFKKHDLYDSYCRDTTRGEKTLDKVLRSYLFDQGIDFPFSKPKSPSGEVDILPLIKHEPIPLEVKVFDGDGRNRSYVKQGFNQAFIYAKDYGEPVAYLVIFNVSPYDLVFKLSSSDVPQRLAIGDKTIFLFTINLYPHESTASKRPLKSYIIDEKYLLEGALS